jgi:asparagine synthase (glutamine-hydrolysing)
MSTHAGVLNSGGEEVTRELLSRISESIAEYGPDGERFYVDGHIGMVYRPLHTTLESRLERQPHVCASGKVMTWEGRLDNRDELISQLHNDVLGDLTDVALVAVAFDRWKTDCFAKLIGDWSVVIWDGQEKELILARDYIGARHLFYYATPRKIMWCTQLSALALCGDQFTLCDEYIAGFLASYPNADLTPYREILSVPAGNFVRMRNGRITVQAYWNFKPRRDFRCRSDAEYEEHFRHLFRQAVRRRLRSDSRILAELSGGLDSSSIVCMADDILMNEGAESPGVDTFSYCDRGEPDEEDFKYFVKVEEKRGRAGYHGEMKGTGDTLSFDFTRFVATPGFGLREELKTLQRNLINNGKFRVMLSGFGGDELLGQAMDPRVQIADLLVQLRLREFTKQLMAWSLLIRRPWIQLLTQIVLLLMPISVRSRLTSSTRVQEWVNRSFARKQRMSLRLLQIVKTPWHWLPSDRDSAQTHTSLSQQMTHRLPSQYETRCPFLDQTLVEFLVAVPRDQLLRPGDRRSLMRRALKGLLPDEILLRRTKAGSARCYVVTLEKHRRFLEDIVASSFGSQLGYIDRDKFRSVLIGTCTGQSFFGPGFLQGLSLEIWLRTIVSRGILSRPRIPAQGDHQENEPRHRRQFEKLTTSASGVVDS